MPNGPRVLTAVSALGIALIGLLFLSPAAGFITSLSGSIEEHLTLSPLGGGSALAQMAPGPAGLAYVANEGSGTISVIDTATSAIVKTICLGSDREDDLPGTPGAALAAAGSPCDAEADHHKPFYDGHVGTHGLWLTPDGRILLVTNRISGTIVAIDTATNTILGYQPVGREPHLATVRPGGREAWVAVRGENYLDVLRLNRERLFEPGRIATDRLDSRSFIPTVLGPSMVSFTSDGRWAFVAAGKQPRVDKIDAEERAIVASRVLPAPFTPFGLVSPDDQELYLVHKGTGQLSVLRTSDLSPVISGLPIGGCANHVAFAGRFAYITIGGAPPCAPGGVDREGKIVVFDRDAHKIAREIAGPELMGDPHGIWPTPDGSRLLVGHERGNRISIVDLGSPTTAADDRVIGTVTGTPQDIAFLKQPIDVVIAAPLGVVSAAERSRERRGHGRD